MLWLRDVADLDTEGERVTDTTETGIDAWTTGNYALDRYDRVWHAYSWHFGNLIWRGLGVREEVTTAHLEHDHGPLRRVQIVEVRG